MRGWVDWMDESTECDVDLKWEGRGRVSEKEQGHIVRA